LPKTAVTSYEINQYEGIKITGYDGLQMLASYDYYDDQDGLSTLDTIRGSILETASLAGILITVVVLGFAIFMINKFNIV